jgi:ElaB/YqjD/DUF883 family membrane-anchored ribosome-binding protein
MHLLGIQPQITKQFNRLCFSWLMLAVATFSLPAAHAQNGDGIAAPQAGHVIVAQGRVLALAQTGAIRELARQSSIYVGDTIFTDDNAYAQLRMVDGAQIALSEFSELVIEDYKYDEDPVTDTSLLNLLRGGLRTITGAIGTQNRDNYELQVSESAQIGIRGTDYEVVVTPQGRIVSGVYDGGTTFSNALGALDLGINAQFDFGLIENPQSPPVGLLQQPPELLGIAFVVAVNPAGTAADQNAAVAATGSDQNDVAGDSLAAFATAGQGSVQDSPLTDAILASTSPVTDVFTETQTLSGDEIGINPNETRGDGSIEVSLTTPAVITEFGSDFRLLTPAVLALLEQQASDQGQTVQELVNDLMDSGSADDPLNIVDEVIDTVTDVSDDLVDDVLDSTDDVADVADDIVDDISDPVDDVLDDVLDTGGDTVADAGDVIDDVVDSVGDTVDDVTDTVDDTVDDVTDTAGDVVDEVADTGSDVVDDVVDDVADTGSDVVDDVEDVVDEVLPDLPLPPLNPFANESVVAQGEKNQGAIQSWGAWNNPLNENLVAVNNLESGLIQVATRDYFADVNPAPVASLTGEHSFELQSADFIGTGSRGAIESVMAGLQVDFNTGLINQGSLAIQQSQQHWQLNFSGSLNAGIADLQAQEGSLFSAAGVPLSNAIEADLGGVFAGSQAEVFVGGFDLLDANDAGNQVNGIYTIER